MSNTLTLLAIDDKPDSLVALSAVVRDVLPQAAVLTAASGLAGLELAAAQDPDVILLDIVMPGMDGFEVCRRLKADERLKDIPVVFVTALKTDTSSRLKALDVGAEGFLTKPLEPAELTAQIRAMIKVKAANRSHRIEKEQMEALIAERRRELRAITDSAQDAIIQMDSHGRIAFWNPAAERMLGYSAAEALGQNLHQLLAPERFHPAHSAAFPEFLRSGRGAAVGKTVELAARRKDGEEIAVALSLSAVLVHDEWQAVGILRDVTAQKRAEAQMVEANRALEDAVARARQMAARAEMASLAKSEFLANMSHEIRTPMNGVIGMTGLLLDTDLAEEQRRYAEIVRASAESLLGLINDILDFSKIEAGKLELEILDFDLGSLLEDFASTLALRANDKGLELVCDIDPDAPTLLRGDPGRLRQVLTNLAGNALKFTPAGEVAIRAALESETKETALLRFSVRDTGIGIPAGKLDLIFDKFTQVDASTKRMYGGTGLGLAISKQLAEIMGGKVGVVSEPGKGSEFWFTARFEKQPDAARFEPPAPVDMRGVRVLIVDDNATNREILMIRLTSWGMRPSQAEDGPSALDSLRRAAAENAPFRLAVIDMQMPGMDGETLGRAIKADPRLTRTLLVMLTSLGVRGDAKALADIGFNGYLTKPVRHHELRDVLALALGALNPAARPLVTGHTARDVLPVFHDRKARILLAEDNITNQQVTLGILRKMGLTADAVANGREALDALETLPYDLVLMDVQMPEMDGLEATRQIRDSQSANPNRNIPIIAMTAYALAGDREQCLEAGMVDYVTKPVAPKALAEALEKWLPAAPGEGERIPSEQASSSSPIDRRSPLIWDRAGMLERLMDDEDLAATILDVFLEDTPRQIEALRGFLEAGNTAGAERQVHSLKGASANVGGEALCAIASEMEQAGKAGDLEAMKTRMDELRAAVETLKHAIHERQ